MRSFCVWTRTRGAGAAAPGTERHGASGVKPDVVEELRPRGHVVDYGTRPYIGSVGGYQAVWRDPKTGVYHGATEMRFDGAALGY